MATLMCACGRPVVAVQYSERYKGIETVSHGGRICCSHFEGEYPTPESAARQLQLTERYLMARMAEAKRQSRILARIHPDDR